MPSEHGNVAIIAAAGAGKTKHIIDRVLAAPGRRALVTTYTNENLAQIRRRLGQAAGTGIVPSNITIMSWYGFLLNQCARPYQRALLDDQPNVINSLNFKGARNKFVPRKSGRPYFLDNNGDVYRDGLAQFAAEAEQQTGGRVTARLAALYDEIYVDEVQDLVGWDLEVLDMLLDATPHLTMVGDPRQHTFSTNNSSKNKPYRGAGFVKWVNKRKSRCDLESMATSLRCNQAICDLADGLFPELEATTSTNFDVSGHDGIFEVHRADVAAYVRAHGATVLRHNRSTDTAGLAAHNIGLAKGATYRHVVIFPTRPMLKYFRTRKPTDAGSRDRLYVAITRAQFSVTFVVD